MKKEQIEALVFIILLVELMLFLWIVFLLAGSNHTTCESYCNSHGTIFSEIKHTGDWGKDDLCVCYKEDNSIITWRMPK